LELQDIVESEYLDILVKAGILELGSLVIQELLDTVDNRDIQESELLDTVESLDIVVLELQDILDKVDTPELELQDILEIVDIVVRVDTLE
jgi:hypothetical protein